MRARANRCPCRWHLERTARAFEIEQHTDQTQRRLAAESQHETAAMHGLSAQHPATISAHYAEP